MPNYANRCQIVSAQFLRLDLRFSFRTPKYSNVLLAMTGLNYSTIAVLFLQQNLGRIRNEIAYTQKQITLENAVCCYVCERFAMKGHNLENIAHRPPALHCLRSYGRALGTEDT